MLVYDYDLMLLPALLRKRFPDITCGFFLHCPFPSTGENEHVGIPVHNASRSPIPAGIAMVMESNNVEVRGRPLLSPQARAKESAVKAATPRTAIRYQTTKRIVRKAETAEMASELIFSNGES